jgi:hypothetical protein
MHTQLGSATVSKRWKRKHRQASADVHCSERPEFFIKTNPTHPCSSQSKRCNNEPSTSSCLVGLEQALGQRTLFKPPPIGAGLVASMRLRLIFFSRCQFCNPQTMSAETVVFFIRCRSDGGARRDRTDDLKLAKLPLSQLSYGPLNSLEPAAKHARRLSNFEGLKGRLCSKAQPRHSRCRSKEWWAWEDLNFRPHAYQARALTN